MSFNKSGSKSKNKIFFIKHEKSKTKLSMLSQAKVIKVNKVIVS